MITQEDYDDEVNDRRAEARAEQRYERTLARHPDCRDPDHPGCTKCRDDEETEGA